MCGGIYQDCRSQVSLNLRLVIDLDTTVIDTMVWSSRPIQSMRYLPGEEERGKRCVLSVGGR